MLEECDGVRGKDRHVACGYWLRDQTRPTFVLWNSDTAPRYDQAIRNLCRADRDNLWFSSQLNKPLIGAHDPAIPGVRHCHDFLNRLRPGLLLPVRAPIC